MKLHRYVAGLFGYELIKKRKLNDTLEQHLANVIAECAIDVVVDVGANTGQYARSLRNHGYAGRIVSFEPLVDVYEQLADQSNLDPKWWSYNLALGARNATATMHTFAASEFSSVLQINQYARDRFQWRTEPTGEEDVQVCTLSDMWPEITHCLDSTRGLLKLDTQGHDLEVLAGAKEILDDVFAIQAEISLKPIYDGAPHYLDALVEFESQGFEITGMYPVSRDKTSLAIIEYDCVMTRRTSGMR